MPPLTSFLFFPGRKLRKERIGRDVREGIEGRKGKERKGKERKGRASNLNPRFSRPSQYSDRGSKAIAILRWTNEPRTGRKGKKGKKREGRKGNKGRESGGR